MKAARFYEPGMPLVIEEIEIPRIKPDEVLLEVRANGICGSDLHVLKGVTSVAFTPIVLGHEMSGVIAEVGSGVSGWKVGQRVCNHCVVACGTCVNCRSGRMNVCLHRELLGFHRNGGLAEYCAVPADMLIALPDHIPFDIGAIITDAVATPYHALVNVGGLRLGETVAVFGVGGLGYHGVKLAKLAGASMVIAVGTDSSSLERAEKAGADYMICSRTKDPVEEIVRLTGGGVDLAGEFVGVNKTIHQAVSATRIGGRTVLAGLGAEQIQTLPPTLFVRQEKQLLGSYSYTVEEIAILVRLAASGKLILTDSISETLHLEEVNTALNHLKDKVGNPIRIVVTPN